MTNINGGKFSQPMRRTNVGDSGCWGEGKACWWVRPGELGAPLLVLVLVLVLVVEVE